MRWIIFSFSSITDFFLVGLEFPLWEKILIIDCPLFILPLLWIPPLSDFPLLCGLLPRNEDAIALSLLSLVSLISLVSLNLLSLFGILSLNRSSFELSSLMVSCLSGVSNFFSFWNFTFFDASKSTISVLKVTFFFGDLGCSLKTLYIIKIRLFVLFNYKQLTLVLYTIYQN